MYWCYVDSVSLVNCYLLCRCRRLCVRYRFKGVNRVITENVEPEKHYRQQQNKRKLDPRSAPSAQQRKSIVQKIYRKQEFTRG